MWNYAYNPGENRLFERMNSLVMTRVRSLLTFVDMPKLVWREAFTLALKIINISPSAALLGETPYTRRFGRRPDMSNPRIWGCLVFVFTQKVLRKKG